MALILMDGFDHYTAAQATLKGWNQALGAMVAGRFGGSAARAASSLSYTRGLPSTYSTLIAGVAWQFDLLSAGTDFFCLMVGTTAAVRLSLNANGQIQVRNSGGTVIATGTTQLVAGSWYYIEIKAVINGASGTCEVHLNGNAGSPEIAQTTGNFGSSNIDGVRLTSGASRLFIWDDLYVCDTSGGVNTSFLGDVRVHTIVPTGAGNSGQWTPNGAASNWDCVNDNTPDDDSTYVSDATVNHIDTYVFDDVDVAATVLGVQSILYARKDDANVRQITDVIRQGTTDYPHATAFTLGSTYQFWTHMYDKDPTGSAWTASNVNADEYGVKMIA